MDLVQVGLIACLGNGVALEFSGMANAFSRRRIFGIGPSQRLMIALGLAIAAGIITRIGA